ncbi:MAG TPA: hypothetical protein VJS69_06705 [Candidatus Krumholzibacteria bacterium]|nr:hypothetical protein [Candidatus Krumholzibacteria bacterium]
MTIFIMLLIAVVVAGILWWLLSFLPLGEPFNRLARGLIIIGLIFYVIYTLWGLRAALPR